MGRREIRNTTGSLASRVCLSDVPRIVLRTVALGPPSAPARALSAPASRTTSVVRPADSKRTVDESAALRAPARSGLDKPVYELSTMVSTTTTASRIMLAGDFKTGFVIGDRLGFHLELAPMLFGPTNRYPTGQRGLLSIWRTGSAGCRPERAPLPRGSVMAANVRAVISDAASTCPAATVRSLPSTSHTKLSGRQRPTRAVRTSGQAPRRNSRSRSVLVLGGDALAVSGSWSRRSHRRRAPRPAGGGRSADRSLP